MAHIADSVRWYEVKWTCREHRSSVTAANAAPPPSRSSTWRDQRDAALAAVARLSKEDQALLYEIAAVGPASVRLNAGAPLFTMQLVRAYQQRHNAREGEGS